MLALAVLLAYAVPLRAGHVLGGDAHPVSVGVEPGRPSHAGRWLLPVAEVGSLTVARWLFAGEDGSMTHAKEAAWTAVRHHVGAVPVVQSVSPRSPAADAGLQPGDHVVAMDARRPTVGAIDDALAGGRSTLLRVLRADRVLDLLLVPLPPWPQPAGGGATFAAALLPETPPRVDTGAVVGSSGGLVLALAELDWLTPGDLTGGLVVAATGAIGPTGIVHPVGAYDVKVAASVQAGGQLFLAPRAGAADAGAAAGTTIAVAGVRTLDEAVQVLCAVGATAPDC